MSERRLRALYFLAVGVSFAAVAWAESELLHRFLAESARLQAAGGETRWKTLAEDSLFWSMVLAAWAIIPLRPRPGRDLAILALSAAAGWLTEALGTRGGLWSYYTGQRPPPWILVAWTCGALIVDRLSPRMAETLSRLGPGSRSKAYWLILSLAAAATIALAWPVSAALAATLTTVTLAPLAVGADCEADLPALATGIPLVLLADLWGTTNACYRYRCQDGALWGLARGIAFGALLDAALVAACLKGARLLIWVLWPLPLPRIKY